MNADPRPGTTRLAPHRISATNKALRGLWSVVWLLLFRPTPRPLHAWRALLLRAFGARIGRRVRVYQSTKIWAPWNLEMADDSCLGDYVDCQNVGPVVLRRHAVVSQYGILCTASRDFRSLSLPLVVGPIEIGAHAWVTADVFIGPGVHIGEGAVVKARACVTRDVPPWTIVGGNPAVPAGRRVLYDGPRSSETDFQAPQDDLP